MGTSSWRQFRLLMWKNWLIQKRKTVLTCFEIGLPVFFAIVIFGIRQIVEVTDHDKAVQWKPYNIPKLSRNDSLIMYTPDNQLTKNILNDMKNDLKLARKPIGFPSEKALELHIEDSVRGEEYRLSVGVVFTNLNGSQLQDSIKYKLRLPIDTDGILGPRRWFTKSVFPAFQTPEPRENGQEDFKPGYTRWNYLTFQYAVDKSIIKNIKPTFDASKYDVQMQKLLHPPYIDNPFLNIIQFQLPFIILLSFILLVPSIVKDIALEKEKRLKESMKMMGLKSWLHWSAWIAKYLLFMMISILLYTIFFCIQTGKGGVFDKSDPICIFVFLFLYAICTISYCCMITTFFSKANSAAAAGGILFFATYTPYFFLSTQVQELTTGVKFASSLLHNLGMAYGCNVIGVYEGTGEGVQWNNIGKLATEDENFKMSDVFLILLIDTILYGIITWYVDNIHPGEFGLAKPWYFPFTKWYWCGGAQNFTGTDDDNLEHEVNTEMFEPINPDIESGVEIRNLRKQFKVGGKIKTAVRGTTIKMFKGQITALLGHNGAGKTTTMNMLTGFISPTSGEALVNGYNIRTDIDSVRSSLGLCPQHDILFDNLTVEEHLEFFAALKGCPSGQIKGEVTQMIKLLGLESKTKKLSSTLSGGQKRKVSVGIALIYGSKVVILDEPTSGMDPEARRQTWDILQSQREGRTIILSTHFMDEADLLGDRIAIMAEGVVQCCGTSLFLKSKYGVGYHMTIVKQPTCNVDSLTTIIKNYVPEAQMESNVSAELSYILPQKCSNKFESMFSHLESSKDSLGIDSFGASVTTMEEVFLKVGESMDESLATRLQTIDENGTTLDIEQDRNTSKNSGFTLYIQQFLSVFIKKAIHSWRNKILSLVQLILPTAFTIMAVIIVKQIEGNLGTELTVKKLSLSMFSSTTTLAEISKQADAEALGNGFERFVKDEGGNTFKTVANLTSELISFSSDKPISYNKHYMIATNIESSNNRFIITAFFNGEAFHTPPISLSGVTNSILKKEAGLDRGIVISNQPLPYLPNTKAKTEVNSQNITSTIIIYILMFGLAFLIASFSMFVVKERAIKAKHSQLVSGTRSVIYWLSTFYWDFFNFLIPCLCVIAVIGIGDIEGYVKDDNLGKLFLLFLLFAAAVLPFTYLLSSLFDVSASAFAWLSVINTLTGIIALLVTQILSDDSLGATSVAKVLKILFTIFLPHYCFGSGMVDIHNNYQTLKFCLQPKIQTLCSIPQASNPCCKETCKESCFNYEENYFSFDLPGIGRPILGLIGQCIFYMCIVLFKETSTYKMIAQKVANRILNPRRKSIDLQGRQNKAYFNNERNLSVSPEPLPGQFQLDDDVLKEKERIRAMDKKQLKEQYIIGIDDIQKYYGNFHAVHGLSVAIPKGECFGLLGVNGAGKTTTFKMLTGDETISSGQAWVNGHSVIHNLQQVQQSVGYCPQFDALIDQLTVKETLYMYARIRGIKREDMQSVVDDLIDSLLLKDHSEKEVYQLSGGNKRKLSTALALIGDPPVVFLDEPTTGMDPVARRLLWDTLSKVRAKGTTLVLTSHSMEECEALCTQIGIMVNGQYKCLGSTQHLKSKFGEGYTLLLKIGISVDHSYSVPEVTAKLMEYINSAFPGAQLKDSHDGYLHYQISDEAATWSSIFGTIERAKEEYHIEDYSVSQTTLEQVFINFARQQRSPEDNKVGCTVKFKNCMSFFCCCGCCA
ncbi:DgyrCDS794 [Dimorphilus gyrociliatus]|uniref:DgyrCDS794 n=1 Tax=Dimorphilus gyrociliatus TaxID=2664684 RepID=A0A7I8VA77_9ANNE|nr:DgyrCDS794 [Dimorphilus gyrociliatus]